MVGAGEGQGGWGLHQQGLGVDNLIPVKGWAGARAGPGRVWFGGPEGGVEGGEEATWHPSLDPPLDNDPLLVHCQA